MSIERYPHDVDSFEQVQIADSGTENQNKIEARYDHGFTRQRMDRFLLFNWGNFWHYSCLGLMVINWAPLYLSSRYQCVLFFTLRMYCFAKIIGGTKTDGGRSAGFGGVHKQTDE